MDNTSVFFKTDCDSIVSHIEDQEEQIRLKRRWLLGCDISESEKQKTDFLKSEFLPEFLLREDDIFYETIKSRVEEAFGICKNKKVCNVVQPKESMFCTKEVVRKLDMSLHSLTSKALYHIAMIVTEGSTSFEKTRWKMKKVVRESIRDYKKEKEIRIGKANILKELHQILNDTENFRKDYMTNLAPPTLKSHGDDAFSSYDLDHEESVGSFLEAQEQKEDEK